MCYSAASSWTSFSISLLIACVLLSSSQPEKRWFGAFIISFALVQLYEGGIWWEYTHTNYNRQEFIAAYTYLIYASLLLQPLVQMYFGYLATHNNVLFYGSIIYLFLMVYGMSQRRNYTSQIGEGGHLVWLKTRKECDKNVYEPGLLGGKMGVLYLVGLMLPLLFIENGWIFLLIGLGTMGFSLYQTNFVEFSSYWCFTAVIYSLAAWLLL